jgi:hypothetical protein
LAYRWNAEGSEQPVSASVLVEVDGQTFLTYRCPICDAPILTGEYAEVTCLSDAKSRYVPGRATCPTPRCGEVCRICRREPGDVHGPDCGPLMFSKLERPHIITKEDCR